MDSAVRQKDTVLVIANRAAHVVTRIEDTQHFKTNATNTLQVLARNEAN